MKKLSITLFAFILFSCSTNEDKQITPEQIYTTELLKANQKTIVSKAKSIDEFLK